MKENTRVCMRTLYQFPLYIFVKARWLLDHKELDYVSQINPGVHRAFKRLKDRSK